VTVKQATAIIGFVVVVWHLASIITDSERCKRNLDRFAANPTGPNFVRLALAEGALISDLGWL
jgi:hypothetical protein